MTCLCWFSNYRNESEIHRLFAWPIGRIFAPVGERLTVILSATAKSCILFAATFCQPYMSPAVS